MSDRYPFTISADQTEIHFTLNQNSAFLTQSGPPELKKQLSKAHETHNQSGKE